jgi:hypothetical protein
MPPPTTYVMSTEATGPRDHRRPAGVIHAAPTTHPPVHTTYCGQSGGLFWFGHVDFHAVEAAAVIDRDDGDGEGEGERCPRCVAALAALGVPDPAAGGS